MSKAIKCDRCGVCFDPEDMGEQEFSQIHTFAVMNSKTYSLVECVYRDDKLDFCPKCTKDFTLFLSRSASTSAKDDNKKTNKSEKHYSLIPCARCANLGSARCAVCGPFKIMFEEACVTEDDRKKYNSPNDKESGV